MSEPANAHRPSVVETEVHVMLHYPHSNQRGDYANLTIRDARSGFEFVDIDLEPHELLAMLGSKGDVGHTKATLRGLEHVGKYQSHETFSFDHDPTADELAALQTDDWIVGTPLRDNRGKRNVTRRRYDAVPPPAHDPSR